MRLPARLFSLFLLLAAACSGEHGFTSSNDVPDVEGNGAMQVRPEEVVFEDLEIGTTYSQVFAIDSVGDANLDIYEVRIYDSADGVFYTEEVDDISLAPGQSREFTVVATLQEPGEAEGQIRIRSNDFENPTFLLPLRATSAGGGEDTGAGDTGGEDTGAGDTGGEDTGAGDTGGEDTGGGDAGAAGR